MPMKENSQKRSYDAVTFGRNDTWLNDTRAKGLHFKQGIDERRKKATSKLNIYFRSSLDI